MDIDQTTLKDMGVKKIGDRVRIGSQAKVFRNREYRRSSKRIINRVSNHHLQIVVTLTRTALPRSPGQSIQDTPVVSFTSPSTTYEVCACSA